jgi:L-alanine-DL-glutamate epimerase-like enolase superfamily enzyme
MTKAQRSRRFKLPVRCISDEGLMQGGTGDAPAAADAGAHEAQEFRRLERGKTGSEGEGLWRTLGNAGSRWPGCGAAVDMDRGGI